MNKFLSTLPLKVLCVATLAAAALIPSSNEAKGASTLVKTHCFDFQPLLSWINRPGTDHWYAYVPQFSTWQRHRDFALSIGADLVVIEDLAEHDWIMGTFDALFPYCCGTWIGLYQDTQDPNYSEPAGAWKWVNGAPATDLPWWPGNLNNQFGVEHHGEILSWGEYNDEDGSTHDDSIIECISIDCNENGVPDTYEIAKHPELDADFDGFLDACSDRVTWVRRYENGVPTDHWYALIDNLSTWKQHRNFALTCGSDLVCIETLEENDWIFATFHDQLFLYGTWIGLCQDMTDPNYSEPGGGWKWVNREPLTYDNWWPGNLNNQGGTEHVGELVPWGELNDEDGSTLDNAIIECISSDCDGDGRPDRFQIARYPSLDLNNDGILDQCQ